MIKPMKKMGEVKRSCPRRRVPAARARVGLVLALAFLLVAGSSLPAVGEGPGIDRVYGPTRYETAVNISQAGWASAATVVLARGDDYADALTGVPLAYKKNAPILLTQSDKLTDATRQEVQRLGATRVVILGGTAAVSTRVQEELQEAGLLVERIAGRDRFETAALVAGQVHSQAVDTAVIAYGFNFPDALAVASYAAVSGMPILLTRTDSLPESTVKALFDLGINKTIVVGGPAVVGEPILQRLPLPVRVSGPDRYATAVAIARYFGLDASHLYCATGLNFADAITGAVLASRKKSGIVLVGNQVPPGVEEYLKEVEPTRLTIFGGEVAVSSTVAARLAQLVKPTDPPVDEDPVDPDMEVGFKTVQGLSPGKTLVIVTLKNVDPAGYQVSVAGISLNYDADNQRFFNEVNTPQATRDNLVIVPR